MTINYCKYVNSKLIMKLLDAALDKSQKIKIKQNHLNIYLTII